MQDQNETSKPHPFQLTLGLGPYRLAGFFAIQLPSEANQGRNNFHLAPKVERGIGTCAHCGHAIVNVYIVSIGDGKRFGVGSDCILKAGLPYAELTKLQKIERERARVQRAERKAKKGLNARNELASLIATHSHEMSQIEHGRQNLLAYASWCLDHSNDGGIVIVLKRVKALLDLNQGPIQK